MRTFSSSSLIISKLKDHYNFKSNVELASFLGITTGTLSGWAGSRGIGNWELIFEKCSDINLNWLIFNDEDANKLAYREQSGIGSFVAEDQARYCSDCSKKDIEISRLKKEIDAFIRILDMLDDKKQTKKQA